MSTPSRVFALLFLLAADLSIVTGGLWYAENGWWGKDWFGYVAMGILFGQVKILAMWLALGDGKWYWRLAIAVPTTMLLAQAIGWAEIAGGRRTAPGVNDAADWPRLVLLVALLVSFTALWPLRQFGKW